MSLKSYLTSKTYNNKLLILINFLPFLTALVLGVIILFFPRFLPNKLPLFYSLPWGENQLANPQQFFIIPAIIVLIGLINLSLSWQLHQTQTFFKRILLISTLISTIILTISFVKIISIFI